MQPLALVIEDEASLRTIYEFALIRVGYQVIQAADGEEGLDLLAKHTPDVIFLDMLLPRVNGSAILEYIHSTPHLQDAHLVVVTAHSRFNHTHLLRAKDMFLLKPIHPSDIQRAARRQLVSG